MIPFDDILFLMNAVLLGDEPTVEDFILLAGTLVAFVAFILWCCFPVVPKEGNRGGSPSGSRKTPRQYDPWAGTNAYNHAGWWGGRRGRGGPGPSSAHIFRHYESLPAS